MLKSLKNRKTLQKSKRNSTHCKGSVLLNLLFNVLMGYDTDQSIRNGNTLLRKESGKEEEYSYFEEEYDKRASNKRKPMRIWYLY